MYMDKPFFLRCWFCYEGLFILNSVIQGVAKLPFIDEMRLLAETRKLEETLTVCICYIPSLWRACYFHCGCTLVSFSAAFLFWALFSISIVRCVYYFWYLLQEQEKFRNRTMFDIIYVRDSHPLTAQIVFLYQMYNHLPRTDPYVIPIDPAARSVETLDTDILFLSASIFSIYCVVIC